MPIIESLSNRLISCLTFLLYELEHDHAYHCNANDPGNLTSVNITLTIVS